MGVHKIQTKILKYFDLWCNKPQHNHKPLDKDCCHKKANIGDTDYKEGWKRAETKQAQWAHTVTDFPFTFIQICRILKCRKCNHCNSSGFFFANTTCCKSQTGYMAAKHKLDLQIVWKVTYVFPPRCFLHKLMTESTQSAHYRYCKILLF